MTDPRRRLRLLVTRDGSVATRDGRLPALDVTVDDEGTLLALPRALPTIGLSGPVLACAVDQRPDAELDGAVRQALVLLEPPGDGWPTPAGWSWAPSVQLDGDLPEPLVELAIARLDEIAGRRDVPELRAAWAQPGWHGLVRDWIDDALMTRDRPAATDIVQVRQWGISTVLRVETPAGRCWFKAAFPPFRHEAAITEWLDRVAPGAVPPVVAADRDRGWLLLDDLGDRTQADDPPTTRAAIDRLVALQRLTSDRIPELLAVGAPDRRPTSLAAELEVALDSPVVARLLAGADIPARRASVAAAVERLDGVLPDGLVHGDFHPGNIAPTEDAAVIFDWSDGAVACPVVDIPTWTWWFPDDRARIGHVWSCFEAAWEREYDVAPGSVDRRAATVLAGAYHTISYVRILEGLEPWSRFEHVDGVTHFAELMSAAEDEHDGH